MGAHDKTKIYMLISVWRNPIASFIFVEGSMAKINRRRHFVPGSVLRNIRRKISFKNPDALFIFIY